MNLIFNRKPKYYAYFVRCETSGYRYVRKKRINTSRENLKYRNIILKIGNISGKGFLNLSIYNHCKGMKYFYFIDLEVGQLFFYENEIGKDLTHHIDAIENKKIIKQLSTNLSGNIFKINITWFSLGLIVGILGTLSVLSFM